MNPGNKSELIKQEDSYYKYIKNILEELDKNHDSIVKVIQLRNCYLAINEWLFEIVNAYNYTKSLSEYLNMYNSINYRTCDIDNELINLEKAHKEFHFLIDQLSNIEVFGINIIKNVENNSVGSVLIDVFNNYYNDIFINSRSINNSILNLEAKTLLFSSLK